MDDMKDWKYVGNLCMECGRGLMKDMVEVILEDGTVVYSSKCNNCGNIEKSHIRPERSKRRTGLTRCEICGFEYFYSYMRGSAAEMIDFMQIRCQCPNCLVKGRQVRVFEEYGELKHEHGNYKMHPITRKHRTKNK